MVDDGLGQLLILIGWKQECNKTTVATPVKRTHRFVHLAPCEYWTGVMGKYRNMCGTAWVKIEVTDGIEHAGLRA